MILTFPLFSYELAIAAVFRNEGPYLKEWIEYHRMMGVEHFWLYNDLSADNYEEVLAPYVEQGIIELIQGFSSHMPNFFITNQIIAYLDAVNRAKGNTKWLALIDVDEFIFPRRESSIIECLREHYEKFGGVYVNWRHFGTGGVRLERGDPILSRLFCCSLDTHSRNSAGKSIVRPEQVTQIWNPHHMVLEPDQYYGYGDGYSIGRTELDLKLDGLQHFDLLMLNHYTMRDESFYRNVRDC